MSKQVLYKLTNELGQTLNDTQWGPGVSHSGTGKGELCSKGWIHAYEHMIVGIIMNPIHGGFRQPKLWLAEGEVSLRDGPLKCGCRMLTTLHEIPVPGISTRLRLELAIRCVMLVCDDTRFITWAKAWLRGAVDVVSANSIDSIVRSMKHDSCNHEAYKIACAAVAVAEAAVSMVNNEDYAAAYDVANAIDLAEGCARTKQIKLDLFAMADKLVKDL